MPGDSSISRSDRAQALFALALGIPIFYGLGCASTTFAGEHDAETFEFQRSLPMPVMKAFWSKIAFAFASTAAMAVFLLILYAIMAGEDGLLAAEIVSGTAYGSAIICLYMAWGIFFSLLMKRPLLAAVLAVTSASISLSLVIGTFPRTTRIDYIISLIIVVVSTAIALADYWLGRRWFCETARHESHVKYLIISKAATKAATRAETLADYLSSPKRWNMILRLGWQHWRQSAWMLIVVAVMSAPLALVALFTWQQHGHHPLYNADWRVNSILFSILVLAMPPLLGSFTFLGDQRRRNYRFFAERGISPRTIWLSRVWPWLVISPCIYVLLALLISPIFFAWPWDQTQWGTRPDISPTLLYLLGYVVLGVCAGQLCSMFFRSGILAGLFGLVLGGILGLWAGLMWLWGINWLWSVAPIPVALLLAIWLRAPDWVLERNKLRAWLWPVLVLVAPMITLCTIVPFHRAYQFPEVDPGFSIDEFVRPLMPEEQATRNLFEQAEQIIDQSALIKKEAENNQAIKENEDEKKETVYTDSSIPEPLTAEQIAWVELNRKAIPLLIEASKGPPRICSYSSINRYPPYLPTGVIDLLIHSAMILESEGQLDDALDRYLAAIRISRQLENDSLEHQVCYHLPFWATRPKQTPERVKNAFSQLQKLMSDVPIPDRDIKLQYMRFSRVITKGFEVLGQEYAPEYIPAWTMAWEHLPSERAGAEIVEPAYTK